MIRSRLAALVLACLAACAPAASPGTQKISFRPYGRAAGGAPGSGAELGYLTVPENRAAPRTRSIELAVLRLPGTGSPTGPPIVYLAGGPGSSAIAALSGPRGQALEAMRAGGDVILLDQRGTGRSRPNLDCPPSSGLPFDRLATRRDVIEDTRARAAACAEHWRRHSVDLAGYQALQIADDLEALRAALGVSQLVLWGVSYGTHLALITVRRHPDLVARAILAGVVGPDDSWKLPSDIDSAFSRLAERVDTVSGRPPLRTRIAAVAARLEASPVVGTAVDDGHQVAVTLGGFDFRFAIAGLIRAPDGGRAIGDLVDDAERGSFDGVARLVLRNRRPGSIGSAMGYQTLCAAGVSEERRRLIETEAARSLLGDLINLAGLACDAWSGPALGNQYRDPVRSNIPVLVITGSEDLTTPPADARKALVGLPNGILLELEGGRHGADLVAGSPVLIQSMLRFLRGEPIEVIRIRLEPDR